MSAPEQGFGHYGTGKSGFTFTMADAAYLILYCVALLALICLVQKGIEESSLSKPTTEEARVLADWDQASRENARREAATTTN